MILVVCVDDSFGMLFNRRRQSSDSEVVKKILELSGNKRLLINSFSRSLFDENQALCIDDDFLINASEGEYCFAEDVDVAPYISRAEKIVLFRWNRRYPADLFFPSNILEDGWKLEYAQDFPGNSHKKITMEVYCR